MIQAKLVGPSLHHFYFRCVIAVCFLSTHQTATYRWTTIVKTAPVIGPGDKVSVGGAYVKRSRLLEDGLAGLLTTTSDSPGKKTRIGFERQ
jgi:hypothetical protein